MCMIYCVVSFVLMGVSIPTDAFAYVDPNAGQTLFRFLFPLFVGLMGTSVFLKHQKARFGKLKRALLNFLRNFMLKK